MSFTKMILLNGLALSLATVGAACPTRAGASANAVGASSNAAGTSPSAVGTSASAAASALSAPASSSPSAPASSSSTAASSPSAAASSLSTAASSPSAVATSASTAATSASAAATSSSAAVKVANTLQSGPGTWYGENCGETDCWQKAACAFVDYELPASINGTTCVSEVIWNNGYNCGGCVAINYGGQKKIAMITNKTGGEATHLDMTPDMFSQLADKSLGEIPIEWEFVPCPISSPVQIRMHVGASQYWFAATVENAVYRTAKLEVSGDGGKTWKETTRDVNNFFVLTDNGGTGGATANVRLTSETGSTVVVENVVLKSGVTTSGTANYQ